MARATRIALDLALAASKSLIPGCKIVWRYAKVEMIPPFTHSFFHGSGGKSLENAVSKYADEFIAGIEGRIREIEQEKIREIKAKEAALKAAQDKAIAEAKKKQELKLKEEAARKAVAAKQAQEKQKKAKAEVKPAVKAEKPKDEKPKGK